MTLDAYLVANALTEPAFAALICVDQSTVNRARRGQVPSAVILRRIADVTCGAVTPNDFFGIATNPADAAAGTAQEAA